MPNTPDTAGGGTTRRTPTEAEHERFLALFSPDHKEACRRLNRLHKRLAGFFRLRGVSDTEKAADVTLDRAAVKIADGAVVPDVERYCFGVARFVAKEILREEERERLALAQYNEQRQAEQEGQEEREERERIYKTMKRCLDELDADDQSLLVAYCKVLRGRARAEYRRQLAEQMKTTVVALRMRVTRLRSALSDCLKNRTRDGFAAS